MKKIKFPDYNIIKQLSKEKRHTFEVFQVLPTAYFRFTYNEDGNKMIALDFMLEGYLSSYYVPNEYWVNKFYKLNKTNYLALEKLANQIFDDIINKMNRKKDFYIRNR